MASAASRGWTGAQSAMRFVLRASLAIALLLMLAAWPSSAGVIQWEAAKKGASKTFRIQGLTLTLKAHEADEDQAAPVIAIRAKGEPPFSFRGQDGFSDAQAQFQVVRVDPRDPGPQVLFASFTGGAHCCSEFVLIEHVDSRWKAVKIGMFDGDGLVRPVKDVDGDGIVDLAFVDNGFFYAFGDYAGSWPPPQFFNVIGGKVVDVSHETRYRKFFLKDMADAKKRCAGNDNDACAGYVADGARAGRLREAWAFMLAHYDRGDTNYPQRCTGPNKCITARDYPQALRWFLEDRGYIERGKR
jgi:hypothetical protein